MIIFREFREKAQVKLKALNQVQSIKMLSRKLVFPGKIFEGMLQPVIPEAAPAIVVALVTAGCSFIHLEMMSELTYPLEFMQNLVPSLYHPWIMD